MDKPEATDNLISLLTSLDASTKVNIPPNLLQPLNPSIISKSLVIKVITNKSFRKAQLRESIMAAWNLRNNVIFKDYGTDVFLVTFESKDDLEKVYRNGPWTFKGDFIGMEVCRPMTSPSSYEFNSINLWVQISGLPCDLVSVENLDHIVKPIGKLKSQSTMDLAKWGSYVRVKVEHNVAKPLTGTLIIPLTNNSSTELKIQYEKLERFCHFCGILGHETEDCKLLEEVNERLADEDTTEKAKSILRSLCVDRFTDIVVSDSLAVNALRAQRISSISPLCQLCSSLMETIFHMLVACKLAKESWSALGLDFSHYEHRPVYELINKWLENEANSIHSTLILYVAWGIWKARCACIFEGKSSSPHSIIAQAKTLMHVTSFRPEKKIFGQFN